MELLSILLFFASLMSLWWLYYFEYKPLVVDCTRQSLFEIRDELFYKVAEHPELFRHPGYKRTRCMINGAIRFAHEATFLQMISFYFIGKNRVIKQEAKHFHEDLHASIDAVENEEIRMALKDALLRMHLCLLFNAINFSFAPRAAVYVIGVVLRMTGGRIRYLSTVERLEKKNRKAKRTAAVLDTEIYDAASDPAYDNWAAGMS